MLPEGQMTCSLERPVKTAQDTTARPRDVRSQIQPQQDFFNNKITPPGKTVNKKKQSRSEHPAIRSGRYPVARACSDRRPWIINHTVYATTPATAFRPEVPSAETDVTGGVQTQPAHTRDACVQTRLLLIFPPPLHLLFRLSLVSDAEHLHHFPCSLHTQQAPGAVKPNPRGSVFFVIGTHGIERARVEQAAAKTNAGKVNDDI